MSPRRSVRLSAITPTVKQAASTPVANVAKTSRKRKTATKEPTNSPHVDDVAGPSTPKRKRVAKAIPPVTPTPSTVVLMTASSRAVNDNTPPPVNRLAVPNGTNATLVTPETHRLVASKPIDQGSPSRVAGSKTTTLNLLDEAVAHLLKVEPKLKTVIEKHPCHVFSPEGLAEKIDPFNSLTSGIISQQVKRLSISFKHLAKMRFRSLVKQRRVSKPNL